MSTQDSNTKKIAYGELHFYYPFKFDNKYSYTQIHKKIEKSPLLFTDEYQQKVIDSLGYSLVETFNDIKKEFEASSSLNNPCILKMSDYQKYKSMKCAPMSINPDDILLEIESGESSIKFYIKDADLELLNQRIIRLQEEYDIYKQILWPQFHQPARSLSSSSSQNRTRKRKIHLAIPINISF